MSLDKISIRICSKNPKNPNIRKYRLFVISIKSFSFELYSSTVCSCHVTYAFESESTLYSCLNVKDILLENAQIEKYILCVTEALTAALEKQPLGPNLQKGCFEMCFRLDM